MKFEVTIVERIQRIRTKVFEAPTENAAEDLAQDEIEDLDECSIAEMEGWEEEDEDSVDVEITSVESVKDALMKLVKP